MNDSRTELYQQVILEHNRKPRNIGHIKDATHAAEGDNPLCGDHYDVYMIIDEGGIIRDIKFEGHGCAISKASSSMMTTSLKGKKVETARRLFEEFQRLVKGELHPGEESNELGKLTVFSGIWQYPARVKCAILSWHAMNAALNMEKRTTTE